jgi:hypothetical protein
MDAYAGQRVVADVSRVVFADSSAASLLKELSAAGFMIQGSSRSCKRIAAIEVCHGYEGRKNTR